MSSMEIDFLIKKLQRTRDIDGEKYRISMKSEEGHTLTLVSETSEILQGFNPGDTVKVKVHRFQRTLEEASKHES